MSSLMFHGKSYKNIIFKISIEADFNEIFKKINQLEFPTTIPDADMIRYAILELVNNSLRAHRTKKISAPIKLKFQYTSRTLLVIIEDRGGGFDLRELPYDFEQPADQIDPNSSGFQDYREQYGYKRFGMGLLIVKKVFHSFRIQFYDEQGTIGGWQPESTVGTIIQLSYMEG